MPPLIEVTLQSLKGVSFTNNRSRIPKVTAAVAFSGSAADMQVGSSFVCPRTGNLMVESHVATTLPRGKEDSQPLIAQWNTSLEEEQPHASIYLPTQDPRLPAMSVSRSNRDSKIVKTSSSHEQPSLYGSEVSGPEESFEVYEDQGGSVIWSQSGVGAVMPEIIELSVSLKIDTDFSKHLLGGSGVVKETPSLLDSSDSWDDLDHAESIFEVGVAYLVLFGNDGGTTLMDLPIKNLKSAFPDSIQVDDSASLRIRVNVYPSGRKPPSLAERPASAMSFLQQAYQLHNPNVMEPILRQLKLHESKKSFRRKEYDSKENKVQPPTMLCGMLGVSEMLRLVACDDGGDGMGFARAHSMDSTIETAPSMPSW